MYSYAFHFHNIQNKQLIPQRYPWPHIPVIFEDTFDAIIYTCGLKGLLFTQQHTCSFFYFCHTKIDEQDAKTKYLANLLSCFQPKCALGLLAYLGLLNPRYPCTQFAFCTSLPCCHKHYINPVWNSEQSNNNFHYKSDENTNKLKHFEWRIRKTSGRMLSIFHPLATISLSLLVEIILIPPMVTKQWLNLFNVLCFCEWNPSQLLNLLLSNWPTSAHHHESSSALQSEIYEIICSSWVKTHCKYE